MVKKLTIPPEKQKEMAGFEDVVDLISDEKFDSLNKSKELQIEDYEIYDFLEKEISRLNKLDQLFSLQIPLDRQYHQVASLIEREQNDIIITKEEILPYLMHENSQFQQFFNNLIEKAFL